MFLHHFINYIYLSLNPKKLTYIVFVFGVPINVIIIIIIIPLQYSNVKKKKKKKTYLSSVLIHVSTVLYF